MKALIGQCADTPGGGRLSYYVGFFDAGGHVEVSSFDIEATLTTTEKDLRGLATIKILDYAAQQSYSMTAADIIFAAPTGLHALPGAAIVNAPADAVTNYNVLTTLLGSLTGAVNTANTKQNDIATKLNTLLSELRTIGIIAA